MAASVDAKLLRATKFPPEFNQKVDMQKVNLQVMKKWIASRISEILGSEDDVVIELCFNLIDGPRFVRSRSTIPLQHDNERKLTCSLKPDIKSLQIQLTGFLDKDTAPFCKELWKLCLSAQSSPQGVPKELLEAKKLELIQEKIDADKAAEEARVRRETQERRDRELTEIRDRERRDRSFRGGRGDNWRGGRRGGDRAFDDRRGFGRGAGRGASPPRRDRDSYQGNRDRYVPDGRRGAREDFRRGRSPTRSASTDSRDSRSRSPNETNKRNRRNSSTSPPRYRAGNKSPPRYRKRDRSLDQKRVSRGRGNHGRNNTSSPDSYSSSEDSSKSRSPVRKRRRYSDSPSRSRSPTRRDSRRLSRSRLSSTSRSRSRSRSPRRRPARELISRSPSPNRRGRLRRSFTRSLTRSASPKGHRRSRRSLSRSRSRSRSKDRDISTSPGPSKNRTPRPRDNRPADISEDEDISRSSRYDAASAAKEVRSS
ncbi:hypothetical protein F5B22DRAFT_410151 [Xylaria bambusicola]|uniref:uncharacterized protein n=1 Tax=Xylaria bambusicola TaxID=326684 RepID=UPI0020084F3F|nr:uncharacterized protein F5B22DRAFT_410151 [Xylaria bambusicola]KAI0523695.1 hypothetical protein F5B22DRAFT_410151 [Xylaria bambusicola]